MLYLFLDIDECSLSSSPCHTDATCTNSNGSFECDCQSGYTGNGSYCEDINECSHGACSSLVTCINIPGSYGCGPCPDNYLGNGTTCEGKTVQDNESLWFTFHTFL